MSINSLASRMKEYEFISTHNLTRRIPVIIRIDGKAFHGFTAKYCKSKWDKLFATSMADTAMFVMDQMQGCQFSYVQSDEISFLLTDYRTIKTDAWFSYNINKIVSISAAAASSFMYKSWGDTALFDSRAFNVPVDEVCNYFIFRQQDATRNAIQIAGQEHFSHKELHKKSCNQIQDMLFKEKRINFNDYPVARKRGLCVIKKGETKGVDWYPPIFSKDRNYIEKFVNIRED